MAKRGRIIRRGAATAPVAQKAASTKVMRRQVEPEDEEELDDEIEDVDDDDEEEEAPRRVSRRVVDDETADVEEVDEEDEDYDADDEEDEPAPVKSVAKKSAPAPAPKKVAAPAVEKAKPVAPAVIKRVDEVVADNVFAQLMTALENGDCIVITRLGENKWQVAKGDAVKLGVKKMSDAGAYKEMISPEYIKWHEAWSAKTYDQKKAYAKKLGVKWDEHEDPRVDVMRLSAAVREKEGIAKYKEEYKDRASRAAMRGG